MRLIETAMCELLVPLVEREKFMDVGNCHAALADAAGNAFAGAVADIASAEDPGNTGLKRERLAILGPRLHVATSTDIAVRVAFEGCGKPLSLGLGSNHDEERFRFPSAARFRMVGRPRYGRDLFQVVFTMDPYDLRIGLDPNVGFILDLLDEVLRHALLEPGSSDDHNHFGSVAGIENGGLSAELPPPTMKTRLPVTDMPSKPDAP